MVGALRKLTEKATTTKGSGDNVDRRNREKEGEEEFGGASAEVDDGDDDSRGIWTVVPHELGRVEEEDKEQMALHGAQSLPATHVEKLRALEGVIAEHDAIKREVGLLRQLVEK